MTDSTPRKPHSFRFELLFLSIFLTALLPLSAFAQLDPFSNNERSKFYLELIPSHLQTKSAIDPSDFGVFQQSCLQTGYGNWTKPLNSSEEIAQRDAYLIQKLNRPFYFQFVPSNDSKLHIMGNIDDFRDMICIGLVLNNGKVGDDSISSVTSDFMKAVLQLPNINNQVLDFTQRLWENSVRDAKTAELIITHPLFNQFNLRDLIGSLFKKPMPATERLFILQTVLKSEHYTNFSSEFFQLILNESSNFISAKERLMISRILADEKKYDYKAILNFSTTAVDSTDDYTSLYQQLSKNRTTIEQFYIFSNLLDSRAHIKNTEGVFLELWRQATSTELKENMMIFAQSDLSRSKWFSREAIHQVTIEGLSKPVSIKTIKMTLSNYRRGNESSPDIKFNVLRLLSQQLTSFDASTAEIFIDTATELNATNPLIESKLTESISSLMIHFKDNDNVLISYVRYLKYLKNKNSGMDLVQKLLPDARIQEKDLLLIASNAYDSSNEESYSFLELLMSQPQVTASGLSTILDIIRPTRFVGFNPDFNAGSLKILNLILAHNKASNEIRAEVRRYLNPTMKYVEDPVQRN